MSDAKMSDEYRVEVYLRNEEVFYVGRIGEWFITYKGDPARSVQEMGGNKLFDSVSDAKDACKLHKLLNSHGHVVWSGDPLDAQD